MDDEGIRVNWRAAIVPLNGERAIYGRLNRLSRNWVIVVLDHNLPRGHRCNLALMLPKSNPAVPNRFVEGRGEVAATVLSSMQFHITVKLLELDGDGETLLDEQFMRHAQVWGTRV
jgi:hypothetical protein